MQIDLLIQNCEVLQVKNSQPVILTGQDIAIRGQHILAISPHAPDAVIGASQVHSWTRAAGNSRFDQHPRPCPDGSVSRPGGRCQHCFLV